VAVERKVNTNEINGKYFALLDLLGFYIRLRLLTSNAFSLLGVEHREAFSSFCLKILIAKSLF